MIARELEIRPDTFEILRTESKAEVILALQTRHLVDAMSQTSFMLQTGQCEHCFLPTSYEGHTPSCSPRAHLAPTIGHLRQRNSRSILQRLLGLLRAVNTEAGWTGENEFCETCWRTGAYLMCAVPDGPLGRTLFVGVQAQIGKPWRNGRWLDLMAPALPDQDDKGVRQLLRRVGGELPVTLFLMYLI